MGQFIRLLHTLQGALDSMEGNFLVNDKGDFIVDHNDNFIEVVDDVPPEPPPPPPPYGDPHVSVIGTTDEDKHNYLPTHNYYCYSLTQQIYTASEINFSGYITGIVFYPRGTCNNRTLAVYITPIVNSAFTTSDSIVISSSDQVMSPTTVSITADEPMWLQFDNPYYYDGTNNLLITVHDTTGTWDSSIMFDTFNTSSVYQAMYQYTDSSPGYSPYVVNSMTQTSYKDSIQLLFNNATPQEPPPPDLPTDNYFMFTNRGQTTTVTIRSVDSGNVFINDTYVGKTGQNYELPANSVIKVTKLNSSNGNSCIYTTDSNTNLSIDRWDESAASHIQYMFSGSSGIRRITSWNGAQSYTSLENVFNSSMLETIDTWNGISNVTSLRNTFGGSNKLTSIPSSWSGLSSVTSLNNTFYGCTSLSMIPSSWTGLSSVTDMSYAFKNSGITEIPNSWQGLSSVQNLYAAFAYTLLTAIPNSWNGLNGVTSLNTTFAYCTGLLQGGTVGFGALSNVIDTFNCFYNCNAWAIDIEPLYQYLSTKATTVTSYTNMFYNCTSADNYRFIPVEWGGLGEYRYEYIEVGGRSYKVVTIGNQKWMAENLDYKFPGLNVADANNPLTKDFSTPNAAYYNYDEATYGVNGNKFGLMYNYTAAKYLDDHLAEFNIPDGWHVPTKEDIETLFDEIGNRYAGYDYEWAPSIAYKLISTEYWNYPGTDDYHFGLYPTGECRTQGANYYNLGNVYFESVGYNTKLATVTEANNSEYTGMQYYFGSVGSWSGGSSRVLMQYAFKHFGTMIRLVKNLT